MITRRAALLGAGLGAGLLALGGCGGLPDGVPDVSTGAMRSGSFPSRYRYGTGPTRPG